MKRIEFFDCAKETDMQKAETILKTKEVDKSTIVNFPYLMIVWEE